MLIAFDLLGTLVTDYFDGAIQAATGLTTTELHRRGLRPVHHQLERGEIGEAEFWRQLGGLGIVADANIFHRVRCKGYAWLPGMRELLTWCSRHHDTVIASNQAPWVAEALPRDLVDRWPVGRWHVSSRQGCRKPSQDFFLGLCGAHDIAVDHLVLVDDKSSNIAALRALGGRGVEATDARSTSAALRALVGGKAGRA